MRYLASVMIVLWIAGLQGAMGAEYPEFSPRITDVAVFKDGTALVMARTTATLENGWARTRDVPAPMLGAFWAFVTDPNARVDFVSAGEVETQVRRPALTLDEIIQANVGKRAGIVERTGDGKLTTHQGIILGILQHENEKESGSEERPPIPNPYANMYARPAPEPPNPAGKQLASFVMLHMQDSIRMIKRDGIQSIDLDAKDPSTTHTETKKVREVAIHVLSGDRSVQGQREVGIMYIQKGVRWIPDYRIELLGESKARVTLQGTIINELEDLENANIRLVVGVPSFIMKEELSPMALRDRALPLGRYFAPPGQPGAQQSFLSNAMMSQRSSSDLRGEPEPPVAGPNVPIEGQQDDLFLYQKQGITLKKGARAIVPLLEVVAPYEDLYTWNVPPTPPQEYVRAANQDQQRELVSALQGAKVQRVLRLTNSGKAPWTLAPAAVFREGAILGQHLLPYTSVGNKVDITMTIATDINARKQESETARQMNVGIGHGTYSKVSYHGKFMLTNFKSKPVRVYITRHLVGTATAAADGGKFRLINPAEDLSLGAGGHPWSWWGWSGVNSASEIEWDLTIPAGGSKTVEYDWYYYWPS